MVEQNNIPVKATQYLTLDEIVKDYMVDRGDPNNNSYNYYFNWASRGLQEAGWDVLKQFKYTFLPVDPATKRVKLPDDFLQYTRVGFQNQVLEIIDLTYDPNLAFNIQTPECHCDDCGCNDEVCYTISNTELTTQEVTLPTNIKRCNYSVDFTTLSFPFTINYVVKSTGNYQIQTTVTNNADLDGVMVTNLGWVKDGTGLYEIDSQSFIWEQFDLTVSSVETQWYINETSCAVDVENIVYTNTTKTCVSSDGSIHQEACTWGFVTHSQTCNYVANFSSALVFPFTAVTYKVNGATLNAPNMANQAALDTFFTGLGFAKLSNTNPTVRYRINQTTDSYTTFSWTDGSSATHTITITKNSCISTNVEQGCADNTICKTTIKPCGCLVMTDQVINTLFDAGLINNTMFQRWVHGGDISTLYQQPANLYGFYNIDVYQGIIQLDPFFRYNTIYLEYLSNIDVDTKEYIVPVFAREYLLAYIHYRSIKRRINIPRNVVKEAEIDLRAQKHNLRGRLNPPRQKQIADINTWTPPVRG